MKTKVCRKCNEEKPYTYYRTSNQNNDGLRSYCIECDNKYKNKWNKKYRRNNRLMYLFYSQIKRLANIEHYRIRDNNYNAANKDKIKKQRRRHYVRYKEIYREKNKKYRNEMGDSYVLWTLKQSGIKINNVNELRTMYPELIELKKLQLKLKRKTYELEQQINSK